MKKMIIGILRPTDNGCHSDVLEIAPDAIESFSRNPIGDNYCCRTISGDFFYVSEEVHEALIQAEGGYHG
ncbi:MAG: hypothetical protein PHF86_11720 [Candidatus Nanoarchaeia archaeon]|nr:hypothetical protein [Candidatus Nanoarchaeia archaeon]